MSEKSWGGFRHQSGVACHYFRKKARCPKNPGVASGIKVWSLAIISAGRLDVRTIMGWLQASNLGRLSLFLQESEMSDTSWGGFRHQSLVACHYFRIVAQCALCLWLLVLVFVFVCVCVCVCVCVFAFACVIYKVCISCSHVFVTFVTHYISYIV